jgi:hypothetical protein
MLIIVLSCGSLVVISLITFLQQIPTISKTPKIYDREYIDALKKVGSLVPQNETLTTSESYPQITYFTDHKARVPQVHSEKSLVEFMRKINSSYLLSLYHKPQPRNDSIPLLIKLVENPIGIASNHKSSSVSLYQLSKGKVFKELFKKIYDYKMEGTLLNLYRLHPNISSDMIDLITDETKPVIFVSFPNNGTTIESESSTFHLNITGTAKDTDSKMKKVEVSYDGLVFQLAIPKLPDDWSSWSFPAIVTSEGSKKIIVRATDRAENEILAPIYITVR